MQNQLKGKKVAIVGLGISNVAVIPYLIQQDIARFAVFDTRINPPFVDDLPGNIEYHLGTLDGNELKTFDLLIVAPGLSTTKEPAIVEAKEAGVEVVGDIELFASVVKVPCVGITGSNGKSTVTALVGFMLERAGVNASVGANFGHPAFDMLADSPERCVLELSSFELETTKSLHLEVGMILNVSEDHLDRYDGDIEKYADAKQRIFMNCDKIIVNRGDPRTYPKDPALKDKIFASFGLDNTEYGREVVSDNQIYLTVNGQRVIDVRDMIICGTHNELNALAAMAMADAMGISRDVQVQALKNFPGLEHRCQLVRVLDGVSFYNDSKATNVASAEAAIDGLCGRHKEGIILLAGGQGKGQDFSPLKRYLGKEVTQAFCFGKDADKIVALDPERCRGVLNLRMALRLAFEKAKPGQAILLSPACASLDQFKGYDERGRVYVNIVNNLTSCHRAKAGGAAKSATGVNKGLCESKAAAGEQAAETSGTPIISTVIDPTYEVVDQVLQIQAEDQEQAAREAEAAKKAAEEAAAKKASASSKSKAKTTAAKKAEKADKVDKPKAKTASTKTTAAAAKSDEKAGAKAKKPKSSSSKKTK